MEQKRDRIAPRRGSPHCPFPEDLELRAKELHQKYFVADAHYDLLNLIARKRIEGGRRGSVFAEDYLETLQKSGVNMIVSSVFLDSSHVPELALRRALDQLACLHEELDRSPGLALCRTAEEVRRACARGQIALMLSFEGAEPLGQDLRLLRVFYELGVRGLGLVWNRRNAAADPAALRPLPGGREGGLTPWGRELVQEAERLGMYIDVSHLNDQGFYDLCACARKPFMASHSNCRALTPVLRNLTDEQLSLMAERGGVIGMNSCSDFVQLSTGDPADARSLARHARRVKELAAPSMLCLGLDFCNEFADSDWNGACDCMDYYDHAWELTAALLECGFSDGEIQGLLGGNLLGFIERVQKAPAGAFAEPPFEV